MSFLIKDILKNDGSSSERKSFRKYDAEKNHLKYEDYEKDSKHLHSCSILQQTLLNKINPYYSQTYDYSLSERPYLSDMFNCDKTYSPQSYLDYYIASGYPYLPLYTRNRYDPLPLMFQVTSKRKGGQVRFTSLQTDALEKRFNSHKYLSPEDRKLLADSLKLTDKQVKTWFQNRRAKWRRSNSTSSSSTTGDVECDN